MKFQVIYIQIAQGHIITDWKKTKVRPNMYIRICTTEDEIMDWIKRGVKTQNNKK